MQDVNGATIIEWGETEEDIRYTVEIIDQIQRAGDNASLAGDYAVDHAAFIAELKGACTLLGLVNMQDETIVAELRALLLASRDHEGETSEQIIRASNGKSEDEREAARTQAMRFSARRGWLDSAVYYLDRGVAGLEEIRRYEVSRKAA